ncbi:MAG: response regulator [SAR324 cluster bacterium]|nr:response regulator [SAR324 cluster bacterium]
MNQILVVDDDAEFRENLVEILKNAGYEPETAASGKEALEKAATVRFEIILLDFMMPELNGIEALTELRRISPKSKIVMITAFASIDNAISAIKKGASEYIAKPFKIEELLMTIRQLLEELKFEDGIMKLEMEGALSSLANSIRRAIIRLLHSRNCMRLMEITRELNIQDHTKVIFHLKSLRESGIIDQNEDKAYILTQEGDKMLECLGILDNYLADQ